MVKDLPKKLKKVNIFFNKRYYGGIFIISNIKKVIRIYGGSYKKNIYNKDILLVVDEKRKDLLLFMLDVRYGIVPILENNRKSKIK